jgi:hypothetical protein
MTTKKKSDTEPKPAANGHAKKTPLNQPLPEGMLGTAEMAKLLKIEPRKLRVILRASGHGTGGERYMWKEADLPKLAAMVKKHEDAAQPATEKK